VITNVSEEIGPLLRPSPNKIHWTWLLNVQHIRFVHGMFRFTLSAQKPAILERFTVVRPRSLRLNLLHTVTDLSFAMTLDSAQIVRQVTSSTYIITFLYYLSKLH
jgi:hypothetical protein